MNNMFFRKPHAHPLSLEQQGMVEKVQNAQSPSAVIAVLWIQSGLWIYAQNENCSDDELKVFP